MGHLNRRQFLTLSTGTTGALLLARCANYPASISRAEQPIAPPPLSSKDGLLEVQLTAGSGLITVGGEQGKLMGYNGQIPGPRLEARPGDTVRIQLTNQLTEPTNLHYHGLHISAEGHADNIFLSTPAGGQTTYEFTIPINHPAGIFYYHPHLHGTVAEQIFAGLGGIFVVRGPFDEIPEIQAAQEEFLFLKDFALDANGQPLPIGHMDLMQGREGPLVTVNGRANPTITVASGGLLRLRLVNASAARFYRLSLENHPFYLVATDGRAIAEPIELDELLLAPGERAEVLVQGNQEPGQYQLLNLPYDRGGMGMGGMHGMMGGMMHGGSSQPQPPQPLATLVYKNAVTSMPLPKQLLAVEALPEPTRTRRIELSMAMGMGTGMGSHMGMGMGMAFLFNGQPFDHDRVDAAVKLNTTEEWELVNVDPDRMDHPFHLHVYPFQVVSRDGQPEPYRAWKDTVLVRGGETVRIQIPFYDFMGKTVYHCHILDHEDLGMMGIVEVS